MNNLHQNGGCLYQDSSQIPPVYKPEMPRFEPLYSILFFHIYLFHVRSLFFLLQSMKFCRMTKEPPLCSERIGFSNVQNRDKEPKRCVN